MLTRIKIIIFLVLCQTLAAQTVIDEMLDKIDVKLENDKRYLNIHYMPIYPEDDDLDPMLKTIPRVSKNEPFEFKYNSNIQYRLVFLMEGLGIDDVTLLYLDEISTSGGGKSILVSKITVDTTIVLKYKDMYNLKKNHSEYYKKFEAMVDYYLKENDNKAEALLKINTEANITTSLGITSRDNTDLINYSKTYDLHWFKDEDKLKTLGRRAASAGNTSFKLDVSFTSLSFTHEAMNAILEDGGASIELDTKEKVLGLLPHQNLSISGGLKMLFMLASQKKQSESTFLSAEIGARVRAGSVGLYNDLPFIFSDPPMLNIGNGIYGDFNFSKIGSLPFFNIYFSTGQRDFKSASVVTSENGFSKAYFSFNQAEVSFSFYWNTSDKLTSRFRMDVGMGFYDIESATYNRNLSVISSKHEMATFQPVISMNYTWAPKNKPVLGSTIKFFDGVAKFNAWLTIFKYDYNHVFRVEADYVSSPMFRHRHAWEVKEGGAMIQLRYRYGLTN